MPPPPPGPPPGPPPVHHLQQHHHQQHHHHHHHHQQHQPPPQQIGPTTPVVFMGHISANSQKCFHILPNLITLSSFDGLPYEFQGKTKPDLQSGLSFQVTIHGRNIDTSELVEIINLNVTGGVQWIPIIPPNNCIGMDYVAITGDFDELSLIIHGMPLEDQVLSEHAINIIKSGPPLLLSEYINNSEIFMHDKVNDEINLNKNIWDVDNNDIIDHKINKIFNNFDFSSLHLSTNKLEVKLEDLLSSGISTQPIVLLDQYIGYSYLKSSCRVNIEKVALLVGSIFDVNLEELLLSSLDKQASVISNLGDRLLSCWKSVGETKVSNGDIKDSDVTTLTHDSIRILLGDEAVSLLAEITLKMCDCLRTDILLNNSKELPDMNNFMLIGEALLHCCKAILVNEFTARAFADIGGVSLLFFISKQQPQLPPKLYNQLIWCIKYACQHVDIALQIMEPPDNYVDPTTGEYYTLEMSGYQSLLIILGNLNDTTKSTILPCKNALNWCALVESCMSINFCSQTAMLELPIISDSISYQISLYNTSSGSSGLGSGSSVKVKDDDDLESNDEDSKKDLSRIKDSSNKLEVLLLEIESKLHSFIISLNEYKNNSIKLWDYMNESELSNDSDNDNDNNVSDNNKLSSLYSILQLTKFIPSLAIMSAVIKVSTDFISVIDWNIHNSLTYLTNKCKSLLHTSIVNLLAIDRSEIILSSTNSQGIYFLWKYLTNDDHVLACKSISEVVQFSQLSLTKSASNINNSNNIDINELNITSSSLGWTIWMTAYATTLIEVIYVEVDNKTKSLQKLQSDDQIDHNLNDVEMFDDSNLIQALEDLQDVSTSNVGCDIVYKLITKYCFDSLISLLKLINNDDDPTSNNSLLIDIALFFIEKCVNHSTDMEVSINISNNLINLSSTLQEFAIKSDNKWVINEDNYNITRDNRDITIINILNIISPITIKENRNKWLEILEEFINKKSNNHNISYLPQLSFSIKMMMVQYLNENCISNNIGENIQDSFDLFSLIDNIIVLLDVLYCWMNHIELGSNDILKILMNSSSSSSSKKRVLDSILHVYTYSPTNGKDLKTNDANELILHINQILITISLVTKFLYFLLKEDIKNSKSYKYQSKKLMNCISNIHSITGGNIIRRNKSGNISSLTRNISCTCCNILQIYTVTNENEQNKMMEMSNKKHNYESINTIKFLCRKGIESPSHLESCISILIDLLPVDVNDLVIENSMFSYERNEDIEDNLEYLNKVTNRNHYRDVQICKKWENLILNPEIIDKYENCENILYSDIINENYTILTLILASLTSSSELIHDLSYQLTQKFMALSSNCCNIISKNIIKLIKRNVINGLQYESNIDVNMKLPIEQQNINFNNSLFTKSKLNNCNICRMLIYIEKLCMNQLHCISFLQNGILYIFFSALYSSDKSIVILAIQGITTMYRVLISCIKKLELKINKTNETNDINNNIDNDLDDIDNYLSDKHKGIRLLYRQLKVLYDDLSHSIALFLPQAIGRFGEDMNSISVWVQASLLFPLLPSKDMKVIMQSLVPHAAYEVLAVKIWQYFEDSYQILMEATEVRKTALSSDRNTSELNDFLGKDDGEGVIIDAHQQLAGAVLSLKSIVEVAIAGFNDGYVSSITLNKILRTSLTEKKKMELIAVKFQRTYTMWATQNSVYAKASLSRAVLSGTSNKSEYGGKELGGTGNVAITITSSRNSQGILEVCDDDSYEARHSIISTSLRLLVDDLRKARNLLKSPNQIIADKFINTSSQEINKLNLDEPFSNQYYIYEINNLYKNSDNNVIDYWINYNSEDNLTIRIGRIGSSYYDAINDIMRRGITKLIEDTSNTVTINKDLTTSSIISNNDYTIYGSSQYTRIDLMLLKNQLPIDYIEELKNKKRKNDEKMIRKFHTPIPIVEEINYNNIIEEAYEMNSSLNSSMCLPIQMPSYQMPPPPPSIPPPPTNYPSQPHAPGPPIQAPSINYNLLPPPPGPPSIYQDQTGQPPSHYGDFAMSGQHLPPMPISQYGAPSGQPVSHYGVQPVHYGTAPSINLNQINQRPVKKNSIKCRYGADCHRTDCYYDH